MKLWIVSGSGWGVDVSVVRAETEEEAKHLAKAIEPEVIELTPDGEPGILWNYDYCPDSRD